MNDKHSDPMREDDAPEWLDELLHVTRPKPLADDGFSLRMMERIPRPAIHSRPEEMFRLTPSRI